MFGPVYHGSSIENLSKISSQGFKIVKGEFGTGEHGYERSDYYGGIPAPIHHLGFGVYFTTILSIAKNFNYGTIKGLVVYYLNVLIWKQ